MEVDQQLHKANERRWWTWSNDLRTVISDVSAEQATIDRIARGAEELKTTAPSSADIQRRQNRNKQLQSKLATGTSKK